jgi:hypothetical protein
MVDSNHHCKFVSCLKHEGVVSTRRNTFEQAQLDDIDYLFVGFCSYPSIHIADNRLALESVAAVAAAVVTDNFEIIPWGPTRESFFATIGFIFVIHATELLIATSKVARGESQAQSDSITVVVWAQAASFTLSTGRAPTVAIGLATLKRGCAAFALHGIQQSIAGVVARLTFAGFGARRRVAKSHEASRSSPDKTFTSLIVRHFHL